ncbi:MAG: DUF1015 domain-containing protein [Candidatus Omnitrophica bacterium]|nr:DUF1015 domain-containing protein [Candidatus Omnitrophota bacterium]
MADIIPLKGVLYNPEKVNDLSKVVAPPYDVISPEEQASLYNSDPHNIIRMLLGKDSIGDNEKENRYTRAAALLKDWQDKDVLKKEKDGCAYVYSQEFTVDGRIKRRLGFIALLRLEDFDTDSTSVYPHENTLSAPKEDRTRLISSIGANLGPIFALFADEEKSIDAILAQGTKSEPLIDIRDPHDIRNKLWRVSDKDTLEKIVRLMKKEKIFIADGHHRYEVGLAFSKTQKDPKYGYILTYFTDLYADGIVILPVHRMIAGVSDDILSGMEQSLKKNFATEALDTRRHVKDFLSGATPSEKRFVIYSQKRFTGLKLKDNSVLDVTALHSLVIEPLQARVEKNNGRISIDFTKDLGYAVNEVDQGRFSLCILLNPTKITEVRDMAFSGRRMPQKSTYFYPKVLTGLVINVF